MKDRLDIVKLQILNASQTVTQDTVDTSERLNGLVKSIYIDLSNAENPDVDVDVFILAYGGIPQQTLYTEDDVTADTTIRPRTPVTDNVAANRTYDGTYWIPTEYELVNQQIRLSAGDADKANVDVTATIVFERY